MKIRPDAEANNAFRGFWVQAATDFFSQELWPPNNPGKPGLVVDRAAQRANALDKLCIIRSAGAQQEPS